MQRQNNHLETQSDAKECKMTSDNISESFLLLREL